MSSEAFDYIIVGAGSAGCVLANRLTEDASVRVLLIEAGGRDASIFIKMPTAFSIPMNMKKFNWFYETEPEPNLNNRRLHCPRGKVLGGSSSINGMVYVRGNPMDFDNWVQLGAKGWSYAEVLPYFRKAETHVRKTPRPNQEKPDPYRGDSGPLKTRRGRVANPLYTAFVEAGIQAGYPRTLDMNGYQQEGFGLMDMTVSHVQRCSSAYAYIHPIKARQNLKVELNALVRRILIDGNRARGIVYERGGTGIEARARREVILSAGAINSPQLLMLSGIGAGRQLQEHGIEVKADLPGVGENLMDHLELYIQQECVQPVTLYRVMGPIGKMLIGIEWMLGWDGLGATNHFEAGGFIRSRPGVRWANIQFHFLPLAVSYDGKTMPNCHGFQAHVGPMLSKSRGWVRLRSPDPSDKARILFNYMSHQEDWIDFRACVRLTREIFAQPALERYRGRALKPGSDVQTDEQIDEFIRQDVESAYHPCGTCKMGIDKMAVVDPECRVQGLEALRVVDASIMPQITNGNLNAPTIMIAEKAADLIKGVEPLPPSNAPYYVAEDWETRQRPGNPERVVET